MTQPTQQDYQWMSLALAQARLGVYSTTPNPAVGCVIIHNNCLIAAAHHTRAGSDHAEILALTKAHGCVQGSTLYVTLEPCFHTGRTPPCVDAVVRAGIKRVVIASVDPNPLTQGKSIAFLKKHGVEVISGILDSKNRELNRGFFSFFERRQPWVISKIAQTLDGKIALVDGTSKWITSKQARVDAHFVRAQSCCILTGIGTILADNPRLSVRGAAASLLAERAGDVKVAIIDRHLHTPVAAHVLVRCPYIFYNEPVGDQAVQAMLDKKQQLEAQGAYCIAYPHNDLRFVMAYVGEQLHARRLLVEAGSGINTLFLQAGLIDEFVYYVSSSIMGDGRDAFVHNIKSLDERTRFCVQSVRAIDDVMRVDVLLDTRK